MQTTEPTGTTFAPAEVHELHREVERYLAAVEVFRREGCEPLWSREERGTSPNHHREAPDAMQAVRT